jgi:hypothetical protein
VPCHVDGPQGLVKAIDKANPGDVLSLAQGCVYTLTSRDNHDDHLGDNGLPVVKIKLTINGNGATITRQLTPPVPRFRIFQVAPGGDLTVNDVKIEHGFADDGGDTSPDRFRKGRGGGIYNLGTLKVINSTFSQNTATFGRGGIGNGDPQEEGIDNPAGGTLTLSNTTVSNNSAGTNGPGIASGLTSAMTLTHCIISDNSGPTSFGGGISSQGTVYLKGCLISNNTAANGGGMANAGQVFLIASPVTGNTAKAVDNSTGFGGGIWNAEGGALTLTDSSVTGNSATNDGAGIENLPGSVATLTSSVVNNNKATGNAGGIGNAGSLALINSIVSGNSAVKDGGGIGNASSLTLINSIVSGNNTGNDGGGIANEVLITGTPAVTTLTGSAVTGNSSAVNVPNSGGGIFNQAGTVCLNGTVVAGNSPNNSTNVVFAPSCQ